MLRVGTSTVQVSLLNKVETIRDIRVDMGMALVMERIVDLPITEDLPIPVKIRTETDRFGIGRRV